MYNSDIYSKMYLFLTGIHGLCILLRRLAYPNRLVDLEMLFGYSYRALSSIINKTMRIVLDNKGHLLQNLANHAWLDEEKLRQYSHVGTYLSITCFLYNYVNQIKIVK